MISLPYFAVDERYDPSSSQKLYAILSTDKLVASWHSKDEVLALASKYRTIKVDSSNNALLVDKELPNRVLVAQRNLAGVSIEESSKHLPSIVVLGSARDKSEPYLIVIPQDLVSVKLFRQFDGVHIHDFITSGNAPIHEFYTSYNSKQQGNLNLVFDKSDISLKGNIFRNGVFQNNSGLRELNLASSGVLEIQSNAFRGSLDLEHLNIKLNAYDINRLNKILYSNYKESQLVLGKCCFADCSKLTDITIEAPSSTRVVLLSNTFRGCQSLKRVSLVINNDSDSFRRSLVLSDGVFSGCKNLNELDLSNLTQKNFQDITYHWTTLARKLDNAIPSLLAADTEMIATHYLGILTSTIFGDARFPGATAFISPLAFEGMPSDLNIKVDESMSIALNFRDLVRCQLKKYYLYRDNLTLHQRMLILMQWKKDTLQGYWKFDNHDKIKKVFNIE